MLGKKILIITPNFNFGGAEKVSVTIANLLQLAGFNVEILTLDTTGPLKNVLNENVQVKRLDGRRARYCFFYMRKFFKYNKYDLVFSNTVRLNLIASLVKATTDNIPKLILREYNNPYKTFSGAGIIKRKLLGLIYSIADYVIAQNEEMKNDINSFYGISLNSIKVLKNPLLPNLKSEYKSSVPFILYVGRLSEQKNVSALITAYSITNKAIKDYKLYIFGDGILKDELLSQVRMLGLEGRVEFFCPIVDILDVMKAARLLVLPSIYEGSPNVVFESLSCGTPVIVSNILEQYEEIFTGNPNFGSVVNVNPYEKDAFIKELASSIDNSLELEKPVFLYSNDNNKKLEDFFFEACKD